VTTNAQEIGSSSGPGRMPAGNPVKVCGHRISSWLSRSPWRVGMVIGLDRCSWTDWLPRYMDQAGKTRINQILVKIFQVSVKIREDPESNLPCP
jgi:hypothetical protein